ncbi:MAG TPA: TolC family protein [Terriglobia bacterium]|nr:TolC family protein [Terriglobia bacterium]
MKRRQILQFLVAVVTAVTVARGQATTSSQAGLTLQDAVALALKNNPAVHAADAYADAVRQSITVAQAARYPRLDFSEGFARGNNPVYVFGSLLTQRQFTARNFDLGLLNAPPPLDNFRTQFTASMPLFDAGQTGRQVRDARLDAEGARKGSERVGQEVIFRVISSYFDELAARASVRVAESNVTAITADLERARARQEQGLTVPSDVLSVQVQLAQAKEDLIRDRNALEIARAALSVAIGLPEDSYLKIQEPLAETTFTAGSLAERQRRALAIRPDYAEATLAGERAANGVKTARAEFLPKINLFSSWEEDNQTFAARGGNNWAAGATLNFNLFDGGANRARAAESRYRERRAEALREQMSAEIKLQVREAFLNLQAAKERLDVSRDSAAQAKESLRILRDRYEAGLVTIVDVLRAEAATTSAERSHLSALYDYRIAAASLELATGELAPGSNAVVAKAGALRSGNP